MDVFKFYIPTQQKRALVPFKNPAQRDMYTREYAEAHFESYAGVLAENVVLIDIDDAAQAVRFLNMVKADGLRCRAVKTTRGMHFFFLNNGDFEGCRTAAKMACGFQCDIKVGSVPSYAICKLNGVSREVVYDVEPYQEAPRYLLPIQTRTSFVDMQEGDGRNNELFRYIMVLERNGYSKEEIKDIFNRINNYVFVNPLGEHELGTILRDRAFTGNRGSYEVASKRGARIDSDDPKVKFFTERGKFLADEYAEWFKQNHHLVMIGGQLHVYDKRSGTYKSAKQAFERVMILEDIPSLTIAQRKEVLSYLYLTFDYDEYNNPAVSESCKYVAFKNGVLNIETLELLPFSPDYIVTNKIPYNWDENARSALLDKTMLKLACQDENVVNLLYEAVGYGLYRRNELRKSFFLIGDRRNGKSTFLRMVNCAFGEVNNVANLDLEDLGSQFRTAELAGKLINIGDDIDGDYIPNASTFKKVVSGSPITVERKGQDPFVMTNYAKFFFSANSLPRIGRGDDNKAIVDRMVIIPFEATFDKDEPDYDPFIGSKLCQPDVIEAMLYQAVMALRRVLTNQCFTEIGKVEKTIREFEVNNNPVELFTQDMEAADFENESIPNMYRRYDVFCKTTNLKALSMPTFIKRVQTKYNLDVSVIVQGGKKLRVFARRE